MKNLIFILVFLSSNLSSQSSYEIVNKYLETVPKDTILVDSIQVPATFVVGVEKPQEILAAAKIIDGFLSFLVSEQAFGLIDKFMNGGKCLKDKEFFEKIGREHVKFLQDTYKQNLNK
jgi:hypothetical protein